MSKHLKVNLEKKYYKNSSIKILENCNFEVKPGEFVTILGASGCGKSTLLKLIVGIDNNFSGEIILGSREVVRPETDCSIIFQEARLFPWMTVKENVQFAIHKKNTYSDKEALELLEFLNLGDFLDDYPLVLSGGMSQKVAIARALINLPDLLLLDEPFAALDYITRMQLQGKLIEVLKKRLTTVLMVTHDIEEAIFLSDRILIMSKKPGKILKTFHIDLPKPRKRTSEGLLLLYKDILSYMTENLDLKAVF